VRGTVGGVTVIDDFAHHPTAVRETLQALREKYTTGRLVAVFEPRSASSRLAVFQEEYVEALRQADYVVIAQVFERDKGSKYGKLLDTDELIRDVGADGRTPAFCLDGADSIVSHLAPTLRPGDTVAVMSNGGFDRIHDKLLAALKETEKLNRASGT
jgi:UDP-N-acetylmuramate: L-alanyl-gamma-D-glutamyl-meso-diaminopimelate ligase